MSIDPPSPEYLRVHAALVQVSFLAGILEEIENNYDDYSDDS